MFGKKQNPPDRIGTPDPENEPIPPRIDDAGDLGPVGETKLQREDAHEKKGIWGERPRTPNEKPADPAARTK